MKHCQERSSELSPDQGKQKQVGGRVEDDQQVVQRDRDHHPEGGAESQADLWAGADLGEASNVVDVEEQFAQVAEEEGEDEEDEDAGQLGLALRGQGRVL